MAPVGKELLQSILAKNAPNKFRIKSLVLLPSLCEHHFHSTATKRSITQRKCHLTLSYATFCRSAISSLHSSLYEIAASFSTPPHRSTSLIKPCWNFRTIYGGWDRLGIGLSYRPTRLQRLAESIPWNWFLGFLKFYKLGLRSLGDVGVSPSALCIIV